MPEEGKKKDGQLKARWVSKTLKSRFRMTKVRRVLVCPDSGFDCHPSGCASFTRDLGGEGGAVGCVVFERARTIRPLMQVRMRCRCRYGTGYEARSTEYVGTLRALIVPRWN